MRIVVLCMMSILVFVISERDQHTKIPIPYDKTLIAKACHGNIPSSIDDGRNNLSPHFLYSLCVKASIDEISKTSIKFLNKKMPSKQLQENFPMETCREFLSLALHNLNMSLPSTAGGALTDPKARADFMTWLSAALADVQTCRDAFQSVILTKDLDEPMKLITTSLSILNEIDNYTSLRKRSTDSSLLRQRTADWAPTWLSDEDKMLLQGSRGKATDASTIVVAADGSGKYKTISEAIAAAPSQKEERFVIYVKRGFYHENVKVPEDKWNVKIYGDGIGKTIVSSNLHVGSQIQLDSTATFAVYGKGFIAMDIEFRNTAGPSKNQAVALLSGSDQSVFYRCRIAGYQDTLWTHSNRQFYRECQILGTIDFKFGDAAAVIQNSEILVRRPHCDRAYITAQGKENPQSKTGLSIQNCTIAGAEDLSGIRTYLGQPWKSHSTTVIMESQLGDIVSPEGWSAWEGGRVPNTIYYVEYNNRGPGAVVANRVKWRGLKLRNTRRDASKFTVRSFINGDLWLPSSTVPFKAGL